MGTERGKYGAGSVRYNKTKDCYVVSFKGKSTSCKTKKDAENKLREFKTAAKSISEV